jgi:hypothetical protein
MVKSAFTTANGEFSEEEGPSTRLFFGSSSIQILYVCDPKSSEFGYFYTYIYLAKSRGFSKQGACQLSGIFSVR